jgi:N-acetylmuramic acid 6-phosphate etherase
LKYIEEATHLIVRALQRDGRLIYVGAGTSGRLGVVDASECPPTYGTDPSMVQGIIAGGPRAVFRSIEGAEDRAKEGVKAIRKLRVGARDVVCGIAASSRTPFVLAALAEAKRRRASTIFLTTNPRRVVRRGLSPGTLRTIDVLIAPDVGPEVIMGSTRMKSGTAQKLVLNMLTTTAMIRLGKVYGNMMVDLRMTSRKLEERARRVIMLTTGCDYDTSSELLHAAGGHVKTALVMHHRRVGAAMAGKLLKKAKGFVRQAIDK